MKALSIKEPYASMIMRGEKDIETRTWNTNYRGLILLHASKKPQSSISGKAFAVVDLVECRDMTQRDEERARCAVYPKAKSWVLENIRLIEPFDMKGQLGLFDAPIFLRGVVFK